jgi:isopentenyl-diphosphate delta-isomerase
MTKQEVILVNENDEQVGTMDKMEAHRKALLHRAFSIFILNSKGEMLLQRRAQDKYHSGGLWTNACCSHPLPGESTIEAAERRLKEELGFTIPLSKALEFIYKVAFENGLTEYEYDHVFIAQYDGEIHPDPDEVLDYCYKNIGEIRNSLSSHSHKYTEWFKIAFPKIENYLQQLAMVS